MRAVLVLALVAALGACASTPPERTSEAPRRGPVAAAPSAESSPVPERPTLADVLSRTGNAPRVRVTRDAVERERGNVEQAGLIPNPVLRVTADRVDLDDVGAGPHRYRFSLRERIETAGKRDARTAIARERVTETETNVATERIAVARGAARLHQTAVAARLTAAARRDALDAAASWLSLEEARVRAGRRPESVLPALRARVGGLRVSVADAVERERTALRELEGLLGVEPGRIAEAGGEPISDSDLPPATSPEARAEIAARNPDIAGLRASLLRSAAEVDHADRAAWPDVTVGLEFEDNRIPRVEHEQLAGVFVEVPLPIADRNQGTLRAASAERRRFRTRIEETESRLAATYAERLEVIRALSENLATYRDEILPARERDLELARATEESGRTDRMRVLELRLAVAEVAVETARIGERLALALVDALALLGRDPASWAE